MSEGREQKIHAFLSEGVNTETPMDDLLYHGKILPAAMQAPPAPESPALTEILTHLDGIRNLMSQRDAEGFGELDVQSTLDKLTGNSSDSAPEEE